MLTQEIKDKVLLNTYGKNLTEDYRINKDNKPPIIGREVETRRCVEILSKKYKNNLVLVAPAGSGKTALVESLAAKLALDAVPSTLKGKELYEVDLQMLSAPNDDFGGPKKRLKNFITEVESLKGQVILFIDEIHIIMGSESEGAMDIANTLKPTLASADGISLIGATTPWEFHKYMEKDAAITRRFTRVNMEVPTPEQAKSILRGRRRGLEIFYGVTISDEAVDLAVDLSERYIPHRNLPDKAIDLLDQAAAGVRVSIDAMPPELDLMQNQIALKKQELKTEKDKRNKSKIKLQISQLEPEFQENYELWKSQAKSIENFTKFRIALEKLRRELELEESREVIDTSKVAKLEQTFKKNEQNLERAKKAYRSAPKVLIDDVVGEEAIRVTLEGMTGIPMSEINADEKERLRSLEDKLHEGVIGQNEAVSETAYAIKRNRLGLGDPTQPMGSFLFLGVSGAGKSIADYELLPAIRDGKEYILKHGDLRIGDYVFDKTGKPTKVIGVYPQGQLPIYRLHFEQNRTVDASGEHLWSVINQDNAYEIITSEEIHKRIKRGEKFTLPNNAPIQLERKDLPLANDILIQTILDKNGTSVRAKLGNHFRYLEDELAYLSSTNRIPKEYLQGSISQRFSLFKELFVDSNFKSSNSELVEDVEQLLQSLGIKYDIVKDSRIGKASELVVTVDGKYSDMSYLEEEQVVDIVKIERLDEITSMTCIMVDNDEHLYQMQNGIVTHNTELVKQLAYTMFGSRDAMKRFDMGEFKSESSISRLIGAPPGEDKNDSGGELTEWGKTHPYSIILFDEAEKANPAIFDLMLSLLDDGELTDSRGERVDFTNTIIVLTSNIGAAKIARGVSKKTGKLDPRVRAEVDAMLRNPDRENGGKGFKPEFINRIDASIIFVPLTLEEIERIADIKLNQLRKRLLESRKIKLVFSEKIPKILQEDQGPRIDVSYWLANQYSHEDLNLGGRPLTRYIRRYIEDALVDMLLEKDVQDGAHVYIRAKYPPGPPTTIGDDGIQRPVKPIIEITEVTKDEYDKLIQFDPIFKG